MNVLCTCFYFQGQSSVTSQCWEFGLRLNISKAPKMLGEFKYYLDFLFIGKEGILPIPTLTPLAGALAVWKRAPQGVRKETLHWGMCSGGSSVCVAVLLLRATVEALGKLPLGCSWPQLGPMLMTSARGTRNLRVTVREELFQQEIKSLGMAVEWANSSARCGLQPGIWVACFKFIFSWVCSYAFKIFWKNIYKINDFSFKFLSSFQVYILYLKAIMIISK